MLKSFICTVLTYYRSNLTKTGTAQFRLINDVNTSIKKA